MRPRWWLMAAAALIAVGFPVARHIWLQYAPRRAVVAFVEALKAGDQQAALKLIDPHCAPGLSSATEAWEPSPRLQYRIVKLETWPDMAKVQVRMSELGYSVQPEFSLERDPSGNWLVTEIANVEVDPRWVTKQRERRQQENDQLARELEAAVRVLPGVVVGRETEIRR